MLLWKKQTATFQWSVNSVSRNALSECERAVDIHCCSTENSSTKIYSQFNSRSQGRLHFAEHCPYLNLDDCLSPGAHLSFFPRPGGDHLFAYPALVTDLTTQHPSSSSSSGKEEDKEHQLLQWGRCEGVPKTNRLLYLSLVKHLVHILLHKNWTKPWHFRWMLWINT